jgi:hypothetical protein
MARFRKPKPQPAPTGDAIEAQVLAAADLLEAMAREVFRLAPGAVARSSQAPEVIAAMRQLDAAAGRVLKVLERVRVDEGAVSPRRYNPGA